MTDKEYERLEHLTELGKVTTTAAIEACEKLLRDAIATQQFMPSEFGSFCGAFTSSLTHLLIEWYAQQVRQNMKAYGYDETTFDTKEYAEKVCDMIIRSVDHIKNLGISPNMDIH